MRIEILSLVIISLILIVPAVLAQEINIATKAKQELIQVEINQEGKMHVTHIIDSSTSPRQLDLLEGTIQNLSIKDENDKERILSTIGKDSLLILPSKTNSIVEYDLEDVLELKNDYWRLDFLYLESTRFIMPDNLEMIYVNERAVDIGDKNGFVCHGCQMTLEYTFDEPKILQTVKWEEQEFDIEIISFGKIDNFVFDQPSKSLTLDITDENKFLTIIIPLELLWEPYLVFLDDERIKGTPINNNGTHVWLNMRPDTAGELNIMGTTVIPEFPIIAPLAIGFLIILSMPLVRKFNLH